MMGSVPTQRRHFRVKFITCWSWPLATAGSVITLSNLSRPLSSLMVNHGGQSRSGARNSTTGLQVALVDSIRTHQRSSVVKFSLSCQICGKMFRSGDGMRNHKKRKRPPGEPEVLYSPMPTLHIVHSTMCILSSVMSTLFIVIYHCDICTFFSVQYCNVLHSKQIATTGSTRAHQGGIL